MTEARGFLYMFIFGVGLTLVGAAAVFGAYQFFTHEPRPLFTQHLFMSGDVMCCQPGPYAHSLRCGRLVIFNASNYIDSGKECGPQ